MIGRPGPVMARIAPMALLVTAGCFATRSDVMVLQNDIAVVRADQLRADSARALQLAGAIAALTGLRDSLQAVSMRVGKFQGDVQGQMYAVEQQLLQIQELTGQSQRRLQELRATVEQRGQELAAPRDVPGAAPAGAPPASAAPGPNQLFQLSLDQLRRGGTGAARAGFQELLRQYPTADVAADAQFYVAETYASEGNAVAADSAYAAVASTYPTSQRAPTALYKRAIALQAAGQTANARALLESVVTRFPRSDEAALARERLRAIK